MSRRILHVAAEIFPLLKTGGLGDVVAALPPAQARLGLDVRVLLPGLPAIRDGIGPLVALAECGTAFGAGRITLCAGRMPGSELPVLLIDAPFLYDRPGNPYVDSHGRGWSDNHRRFALLGWVAAQIAAGGLLPDWQADILHCHDWHAGLAPAYLAARPGPRAGTVFTIHNLAYQGVFDAAGFTALGLPQAMYAPGALEFHGQMSFMKGGLIYADRITTVRTLELEPDYFYLINPGSVGQPRDRDPRVSFLTYDPANRRLKLHRLDYDHAGAARAILAAGLHPNLAERLQHGM